MPHTVRQHTRRTASGGTTTVRQHTRKGGSARPRRAAKQNPIARMLASRRARRTPEEESWWAEEKDAARRELAGAREELERVSERDQAETDDYLDANDRVIAAEDRLRKARGRKTPRWRRREAERVLARMADDMRAWRSRPEPQPKPEPPMTPELARALGCDTPEGLAKYERGRAYREAGYRGPLDKDNRIPDPDDPANYESLSALAGLSQT